MEPNVFMGYIAKGIACVLNSFGHEQYPFKNEVGLWCLITYYPNEGIGFLRGWVGLCNTPSRVKIYVMEHNVFLGYLERGIVNVLSSFGHE
jgi:hypothetical protein